MFAIITHATSSETKVTKVAALLVAMHLCEGNAGVDMFVRGN